MKDPRNCKEFKYFNYEVRLNQIGTVCYRMDASSGAYVVGRRKQKGRPMYKTISIHKFEIPLLPSNAKGVDWEKLPVGAKAALTKIVPDFTY